MILMTFFALLLSISFSESEIGVFFLAESSRNSNDSEQSTIALDLALQNRV